MNSHLEDYFTDVVENVDFEAIFEHDEVFSEIPLGPVAERIRDFIIELDNQDLTQFDSDVIGRIYEGVIPPERRHDMGEYYPARLLRSHHAAHHPRGKRRRA